jgi:hypothetical protein
MARPAGALGQEEGVQKEVHMAVAQSRGAAGSMSDTTPVSGSRGTGKAIFKEQRDLILCPVDQRDALQTGMESIFFLGYFLSPSRKSVG